MVIINTIIFLVDTNKHKVYVVHKTPGLQCGRPYGFLDPSRQVCELPPNLPSLVTYVNITEWYNKTYCLNECFL